MRFLRWVLVLFFTSNASYLAQSQQTLPEFIRRGIENYPVIKQKLADKERVEHERETVRTDYIPKLSVQHQYTYGTSNSLSGAFYPNPAIISPSGGIRPENINQATWGSYTSALLEWNVFNFGRVSGNLTAASKASEAAGADYENEIFQHQIRIAHAYLLVLVHKKLTDIQRSNMRRAQVFADVVRARVNSGLSPGVEAALADAEASKAGLLLLQSESDYHAQKLRLLELTGSIGDTVGELDSLPFLAALPPRIDTGAFNTLTNPLLRYHRLRTEAAQSNVVSARRSFYPSITLVGAAWARGSGISPTDDSFHTDFSYGTQYRVQNYLLGVSTRWILSDFFSVRQRQKAEHFRAMREQEVLNEKSLLTTRQVREAEIQQQVAWKQAATTPVQLHAAREAFEQATARYESGLMDLPTMMQSLVTLTRAETDLTVSYINVWRSLLSAAAAKGDFSIFMNAVEK